MSSKSDARLNILILLNRVPWPLNDGGAIGAYNFVKGYAYSGCKVTMLAMNTSKHFVEKEKVLEVLGGFGAGKTVPIDNRIKAHKALQNLFTSKSYVIERFESQEYTKALINTLTKEEFDVVHVDGLPPAVYIPIIRQYSKAKISMRAHNVEHMIWERIADNESSFLKKIYLRIQSARLKKFEIKALGDCDVVLAISKEDEETIRRIQPKANTIIVPAGMDVASQVVNRNFDAKDLFFIGSFDWMPNTQGMQWFTNQVWPSLSSQIPQLKLTIAGKQMPDWIHDLKSESLSPVGEVPDAKAFMLQHGVMIVPIISGSGIRIKILEGMALGKTIIATTIAAEGLGLTDGKNILIADDAATFASKLSKCINDPEYCRSIGRNAYAFAYENYRNQRIFEKLVAYYRKKG